MIVVVDATCLIGLCRIERLDILKELFDQIYICEAVYTEVVIRGKGRPGAEEVRDAKWIEKRKVKNRVATNLLQRDLDLGEAETIVLANEMNANYVVLDDRESYQTAKLLQLNVIGTIGILDWAVELGIITDFKNTIDELRKKGFRIKDELYYNILRDKGIL